jgi:hypothetical protein
MTKSLLINPFIILQTRDKIAQKNEPLVVLNNFLLCFMTPLMSHDL